MLGSGLGGSLVGIGTADIHTSLLTSFHGLLLHSTLDESFLLSILIPHFPPPF